MHLMYCHHYTTVIKKEKESPDVHCTTVFICVEVIWSDFPLRTDNWAELDTNEFLRFGGTCQAKELFGRQV